MVQKSSILLSLLSSSVSAIIQLWRQPVVVSLVLIMRVTIIFGVAVESSTTITTATTTDTIAKNITITTTTTGTVTDDVSSTAQSNTNQSVASLSLIYLAPDIDTYGVSEFQAVSGGKIALPCNTSLWEDNQVSLVLWYKGSIGIPIYRVDARNNPLSKSKHFPSDELKQRFYFDVTTDPPMLKIDPIIPSDEGEYRCRVDYRVERTQNVVISLNITVPPKEVLIMDMEGQKLEALIGPYDEDASVLLICEAEGGKPSPSVLWFHGTNLIDDSFTTGPHGLVRNELNLRYLNRTDFMSILTCRASNTDLSEPVSSSVILDMNLKPLNVLIITPIRPLVAGMHTEMQCRSSGSRPPAQISWWKGSQRINNVRDSVINDGNTTFSTVSFVPSLDDNGKHFSCRADNIPMPHTALEDGRILTVHFAPQMRLSFGANIQRESIREGSDIFFECHIRANPWIKEVSWLFDGKPLLSSQSDGIIVTNQSLVLQKVRRNHRGRYQCAAFNTEGDGISEPIVLSVKFAPVCKANQKRQYGVARNEDVKVRCEVDADPHSNLEWKWYTNSSTEVIDLHSFAAVNSTTTIATYTPKTRQSYGTLLCMAENSIGRQREPCVFNIVPAGPPESVRNCAITNHSMTTLLLDCVAGDDGGLHQLFLLEVYNTVTQRLISNHSSSQPLFIVNNLSPGTQFTLNIYAANAKGRSHSVSLVAVTLSLPEKHIARGSIDQIVVNPILGILIAIVALLVLIAIIVVIVIKARSNQFNESDDHKNKGDNNSTGMLDNSHTSLHVETNENDQQIKEFVDIVTSINEFGLTTDLSYNGMQMNSIKHLNSNRNSNCSNNYNKLLNCNQYNSDANIKSPNRDVTYAELTIGSNTNAGNNSVSAEQNYMIRRRSMGATDPLLANANATQYAKIDFQHQHQHHNQQQQQQQQQHPQHHHQNQRGKLDGINCLSSPTSSVSCLVGSMLQHNRDSPVADGSSETEATVETPLMNNIGESHQQYRPHEIRITKADLCRMSKSGATPV